MEFAMSALIFFLLICKKLSGGAAEDEFENADAALETAAQMLLQAAETLQKNDKSQPPSQFNQSLIDKLKNILSQWPEQKIQSSLYKAEMMASGSQGLPDVSATRYSKNYFDMCPENFADAGDQQFCVDMRSVPGVCGPKIKVANMTPLDKMKLEQNCMVSWPVLEMKTQDFTMPCPHQWTMNAAGVCRAPARYAGKCVRSKNFGALTSQQKKRWAETCGVDWPKKAPLNVSTSTCPNNWKAIDADHCLAPRTYIGPCASKLPLRTMSLRQRAELAEICHLDFVAPRPTPVIKDESTNIYREPCPTGWKLENYITGICSAPRNYAGPCPQRFSFKNYTADMKAAWASVCTEGIYHLRAPGAE